VVGGDRFSERLRGVELGPVVRNLEHVDVQLALVEQLASVEALDDVVGVTVARRE